MPETTTDAGAGSQTLDPQTAQLLTQAITHHKADRLARARELYQLVLERDPDNARALQYLGVIARRQGRAARAVQLIERSLQLAPEDPGGYHNLSRACIDAGRPGKAAEAARRGLDRSPENAQLWNQFANALTQQKKFAEAVEAQKRAMEIAPDNPEYLLSHGATLQMMGYLDDAERAYQQVVERNPDMARAHQNLGALLKSRGDMEAARRAYLKAVEIEPDMTGAWRALADMKKYAARDDHDVARMLQVYRRQDLEPNDRANICFALAKVHDDIGACETAFAYYEEGNAAKRAQLNPNTNRLVGGLRRIRLSTDAGLIARWRGCGDPDPTPIFILGMPRSGTTLTEQILASHPEVEGAGELYDLARTVGRVGDLTNIATAFPEWLCEVDEESLRRLGRAYIEAIRADRPNARFITDKMPANFRFVGLIRMMLPNAKIIHTRRHPADTCLSCYTKLFNDGQEFSYNLIDLGRYYRAYEELMAHWRAVLAPGDMLELEYESLVSDMEAQARRLLDYCGLEWDEACLRFHENKRSVATASVLQVRRPVYTSSVQRWRRYEKHLGPLFAALGHGFKESGPE